MTVAELKRRLVPGTKLTLINCLMGPCQKLRTVERIRSKHFVFHAHEKNRESVLQCPKASQLIETENGFRILNDGEIAVEYVWGWPEDN